MLKIFVLFCSSCQVWCFANMPIMQSAMSNSACRWALNYKMAPRTAEEGNPAHKRPRQGHLQRVHVERITTSWSNRRWTCLSKASWYWRNKDRSWATSRWRDLLGGQGRRGNFFLSRTRRGTLLMSLVVILAYLCKLGLGRAQLIRAPLFRRFELCLAWVPLSFFSSNLCKV